jgi:hypothetical protein
MTAPAAAPTAATRRVFRSTTTRPSLRVATSPLEAVLERPLLVERRRVVDRGWAALLLTRD